ncbi:ribose-phosphate diphosphokinase [Salinarimonas sp.]|uniref:ribose-phosphate diphosphokinase n=1 Tax=Salinarimonas sp. TaxID=2766526 RepID=UPI0032D96E18
MTHFAQTPAPLRRLFERLDFAPRPSAAALADLLARWEAARGASLCPAAASLEMPEGEASAILRPSPDAHDYVVAAGAPALAPLLGRLAPGARLGEAPQRRDAVRLRRLLDETIRAGEPVLAAFTEAVAGAQAAHVEILAAPLSEGGGRVDAVLVGLDRRAPAGAVRARPAPAIARGEHAPPLLFAVGASADLGARIAARLGLSRAVHEERVFVDGERKLRPLVDCRARDVVVIDALAAQADARPDEALMRHLILVDALRGAGARRITSCLAYLCYARKERRTQANDPVSSRLVARLIEAAGVDRIAVLEPHVPAAFENALRIETRILDPDPLLAERVAARIGDAPIAVVSPDLGGAKRAEAFRRRLEARLGRPVAKGFLEKGRSAGEITGDLFAGDVDGRVAIVRDDLIAGGGTAARAAAMCAERGAREVIVCATHGLFSGGAPGLWDAPALARVIVTESVPRPPLDDAAVAGRLEIAPLDGLLAEAIVALHPAAGLHARSA